MLTSTVPVRTCEQPTLVSMFLNYKVLQLFVHSKVPSAVRVGFEPTSFSSLISLKPHRLSKVAVTLKHLRLCWGSSFAH